MHHARVDVSNARPWASYHGPDPGAQFRSGRAGLPPESEAWVSFPSLPLPRGGGRWSVYAPEPIHAIARCLGRRLARDGHERNEVLAGLCALDGIGPAIPSIVAARAAAGLGAMWDAACASLGWTP